MAGDQAQTSTGTIIRGADGALYFLRPEVLEACRITEQDMAEACGQLLDQNREEVQGFMLTSGPVVAAHTYQGPFQSFRPSGFGSQAASTVMCPGSFSPAQFVSLPASQTFRG